MSEEEPWRVPDLGPPGEQTGESVPFEVLSAAQSAFEARVPDAVLLPVVFDSLHGERRSTQGAGRQLRFGGLTGQDTGGEPPLGVEVTVDPSDDDLTVTIVTIPRRALEMTVRHGGGTTGGGTDDLGRLVVPGLAPGPFSIVVHGVEGLGTAQTAWVTL